MPITIYPTTLKLWHQFITITGLRSGYRISSEFLLIIIMLNKGFAHDVAVGVNNAQYLKLKQKKIILK